MKLRWNLSMTDKQCFGELEIYELRKAMLGDQGAALIDLIFTLNTTKQYRASNNEPVSTAVNLGLIDPSTGQLTPLGQLIADPIREYKFWLDRGRRLHAEHHYDLLSKEHYLGKDVIELGSGFGCNLFSMTGTDCRMVGVEPVALYRQMTPIFAERESIPTPKVVDGHAESIPFASCSFDIVLCYSCHQYMDIRIALMEMARVLRPGGQLQIIGGTLCRHFFGSGAQVIRRKGAGLPAYLLTVANTLAYSLIGRRLFIPKGHSLTTAPIYPSIYKVSQWMSSANFNFRSDLSRAVGSEMCFIADRR
jgi:SAM-dependent methyltransferase